jgi:N-acetylglutamate synthase-like GNAT family acetyltransferase
MTPANLQVRRATLDDLVMLRWLWQHAELPATSLEKRFTEFQVVETASGDLLAAIGFQIEGQHGKIHSEAYPSPELADELRPRLWERVLALARNHGLCQIWIPRSASVFWLEQEFEMAGSDALKKLPPTFAETDAALWLTLKLREQTSEAAILDQEFEVFRLTQKQESERRLRQARGLKVVALFIAGALLVLVGFAIWYVLVRLKGAR